MSGTAIASLVCGIGAFSFLPLIGGVAALILGYSARKEMARDPQVGGEGFATAGIVLGWIAIAFAVLLLHLHRRRHGKRRLGRRPDSARDLLESIA